MIDHKDVRDLYDLTALRTFKTKSDVNKQRSALSADLCNR